LLALLSTRRLPDQLRTAILCAAVCLFVAPSHGQRSRDPLTPNQEEQVRAVADQPNERVKLYIKFIEDRTEAIHHAVVRPAMQHPGAAIHDNIEDFTRLVDELQDNLDAYDESHSDVRKGLKYLLEHLSKWPAALDEPPGSPDYDFVRKSAQDAVGNMKQSATELLKSQEEYFGKHKAEPETKKKPEE
jgi:gas vesicle protein